jgi:Xaa-Pro dipeptidase
MSIRGERRKKLAERLSAKGVFAAILEDFEGLRSQNVRYLSGHPSDAILFVFSDGGSVLAPWDASLARERADVDQIIPYTDFQRSFRLAVSAILKERGLESAGPGRKVEVSSRVPHSRYLEICGVLEGTEVICTEKGVDEYLSVVRAIKDPSEISAIRRAAGIANALIGKIEGLFTRGEKGLVEIDLAQLLEREAISLGAEGLGFDTLAAGPERSWGIHAFPPYTAGKIGGPGFSILDFGVMVEGYTSDVTLTLAREPLSKVQREMLELVERAYGEAHPMCKAGLSPQDAARAVDDIFGKAGWKMPHGLGHGIGLDTHERPFLRTSEAPDTEFLPGMVFTLEPGLYHPEHGGVRLENDLLIAEACTETLTLSKIMRR